MNAMRRHFVRVLMTIMVVVGLTSASGCGDDFSLTAFRDAAAGSLTDGITSVVEGLLTGFFAGLNPAEEAAGGTGQTSPAG